MAEFFDYDVVYEINKENLGLVLDSSYSDDPINYYGKKLEKRYLGVEWYLRSIEKVAEEKVKLCDRYLQPGNVVRKIVKGKDTQLGYCRYTDVKADVQVLGTQKVIVGVDSKDLIPMKEFVQGVAVFKDSWVGRVKNVKTELTLRCSDGSRCIVSEVAAFHMDDVLDGRLRECERYSFYPGQQLWGPINISHVVKWLNVTKSVSDAIECHNKSGHVTVEDVKIISADIQWVCKAYSSEESARNPAVVPKYHVSRENLKLIKMMDMLQPCTLQIGDRSFLIMKENFEVISLDEWKNRMSSRLYESHNNFPLHKRTNKCDDFEDIKDEESGKSSKTASVTSHFTASSVDIGSSGHEQRKRYATKLLKETLPLKPGEKLVTEALITETKAHVVWQDGTVEHNILSTCLYPFRPVHPGHEFFPGDYVVDWKETRPYEYGVVKQVDYVERTALITWMRKYHAGGDPHPEVLSEEEVSMYDIKRHPDFAYRPGRCVIRVVNSEDSNPASSAGQVVDVHSTGKVEVSWVSGETSLCYPQELYRVGKLDSDDLWAYFESLADDESFSYEEDFWGAKSKKSVLGNAEEHQQSLVERLKRWSRVNIQQIFNLFSSSEANFEMNEAQSNEEINMDFEKETVNESSKVDIEILIDSPVGDAPLLTNNSSICNEDMSNRKPLLSPVSPTSGNGSEPHNLFQQLGAIPKSRPLKACEDAELRFGMSRSEICAGANEVSNSVLTIDIKENDTEKPPEEDVAEVNSVGTISMLESVPDRHVYKHRNFQPKDPCAFSRIVRKEMAILRSSLPEGIVVKSFEDRIDLYSVLIKGPKGTPYEDGLFFFDFKFPANYPKKPPLCHYISYCSDGLNWNLHGGGNVLNRNLYEGGKVYVSLLNCWGKGTEKWNPGTSNLLQAIVSIQGLLVSEPHYDKLYCKRQKGTELGRENSRMYNEMVVLKLVPAMTKLLLNPPEMFKQEITEHFQTQASKWTQRLESWLAISETWNSERPASPASPSTSKELHNCDTSAQDVLLPEFPLIPVSKGFGLSLRKYLAEFKEVLSSSSIV